MKDLLQKFKSGGPARLTLAAFGKHPGWDDHIPAIGVATETLAYVEKTLYDKGIRGQIDAGAWEKAKLDPAQRLQGYDHLFLWYRAGHLVLGELWSSTDGKGRLNYPMVLCIQGEGVGPNFMVQSVAHGLDRIKASCRSAPTSDAVMSTCRTAQEQLRNLLAEPNAGTEHIPAAATPGAFLNHRDLGPDRLGLRRVLHELGSVPGVSGAPPSRHLRVPLAADAVDHSIILWHSFLRCVLPDSCPFLLLTRHKSNWLDIIVGEPVTEDFFCLQAAGQALPLTSEIPYEISPELQERAKEIESRFTDQASAPARLTPAPVPEAPRTEPRRKETTSPASSYSAAPAARSNGKVGIIAVVVLVLAAAGLGLWLLTNHSNRNGATSSTNSTQPGTKQPGNDASDVEYQEQLVAARAAFESKDYSNAVMHAEIALKTKPGDAAAAKVAEDARKAIEAAGREQNYKNATNAAVVALEKQQFAEATNQAGVALKAKPGDPVASDLMLRAQQGMNVALVSNQKKSDFAKATKAAAVALQRKDFREAVSQASLALTNQPGDVGAADLLARAQRGLKDEAALAQTLKQYQDATNAAAAAIQNQQFQQAIDQAAKAVALRDGDLAAQALKARAEEGLATVAAQSLFGQGKYSEALAICKKYPSSETLGPLASSIVAEQKSVDDCTRKFVAGDYTFVNDLQSQNYRGKPAFASLVSQAHEEQKALADLAALKAATNWTAVQTRFGAYPADRVKKAPFAEIATWADAQAKAAQVTGKKNLAELDTDLEVLMVTFGMLKPTDSQIQSDKARKTKPLRNIIEPDAQVQAYLKQVRDLQAGYKEGNWLTQNNRDRSLKDLERTIVNWNN